MQTKRQSYGKKNNTKTSMILTLQFQNKLTHTPEEKTGLIQSNLKASPEIIIVQCF